MVRGRSNLPDMFRLIESLEDDRIMCFQFDEERSKILRITIPYQL